MSKRAHVGRWLFGSLAVSTLIGWLAFNIWQTKWYTDALPAQLETQGFAQVTSNPGLLGLLVPFSREGFGTVIFQMTDQTRDEIKKHGISYLADARQGRGHPGNRYYSYAEWQRTPPGKIGLFGAENFMDQHQVQMIRTAIDKPGGFHTHKDEANLIVLPDLGLIIFTYMG